jgi:hypothetical protein
MKMVVTALAGAVASVMLSVPCAQANPTATPTPSPSPTPSAADTQFLAALQAANINGNSNELIADGHAACNAYGTGGMPGVMSQIQGLGLSNTQAKTVIASGMKAYCPEKVGQPPVG